MSSAQGILRLTSKLMLVVLLGSGPVTVEAAVQNTYTAQSAVGSADGSSCANARALNFFNTDSNWGTGANQIGPGTTVHLCGTISTSLIIRGNGAANNPITVMFEPNAKMSASIWDNVTWDRAGIYAGGVNSIVVDGGTNGLIESTDNGTGRTYQVNQIGIWFYGCNDCEIKNLTITGMYVRTPLSSDEGGSCGIYASGNRVRIHDNRISEANTGIAYNYPGDSLTQDVKIYNNRISRISNGITFGSGNTGALADDVQIYANDITDGFVWDGILSDGSWFHNDGIQLWAVHDGSQLTNLKIYNNYVHGDMGRHITGWIFVEGNIPDAVICNNVLVCTGTSYPANGMIMASGKIYNNTIVTLSPGICINSGARSDIQNNLMYNCGCGIGIHSPDANTRIDYNLYTFSDGFSMATVNPNGGAFEFFDTFNAWQSAGFDTHSRIIDPKMIDPVNANFRLQSTSPAIKAGTNLTSVGIPTLNSDKAGITRPPTGAWDVGAFQYTPATPSPPSSPKNFRFR